MSRAFLSVVIGRSSALSRRMDGRPSSEKTLEAFRKAYASARRDGLAFVVLTVLLTPPALVLAVFLVLLGFQSTHLPLIDLLGYPRSVATALNLFLGFLLVSHFSRPSRRSPDPAAKSGCLGAALLVFGLLLLLSYGTAMTETRPGWFWSLYATLGVLFLGLLGRVHQPAADYYLGWLDGWLDDPMTMRDDVDRGHQTLGLVSLIPRTILESYGEITGGGWIIRGLDDRQQRLAAEMIGAFASGNPRLIERVHHQLDKASVAKIIQVLDRMQLVRFAAPRPFLTPEGERLAGTNSWY